MATARSCTIFYSWQSDSPNATNRGFIEDALRKAAKAIREDESITVEPRIDSDTQGVPGAPDISATILDKIDQADIFVGDVTIIGEADGRPTPNPNVLLELGYALKALGPERTLLVMNTRPGGPEKLPFDLRQRSVTGYSVSKDDADKAATRALLAKQLESKIRGVIDHLPTDPQNPPPSARALEAMESGAPTTDREIRRFMEWLVAELDGHNPSFDGTAEHDENALLDAIDASTSLVAEFTKVAEMAAEVRTPGVPLELYRHFDKLLERYVCPPGVGARWDYDYDFCKFIGHELATTLVAFLLRARKWDCISKIAAHPLSVANRTPGKRLMLNIEALSAHVKLLAMRRQRLRPDRVSLHADILKERHTAPPPGELIDFALFAEADLLLCLRSELSDDGRLLTPWVARSGPMMGRVEPSFLGEAIGLEAARGLTLALGLTDLDVLKRRLAAKQSGIARRLGLDTQFEGPLAFFDPATIGTR